MEQNFIGEILVRRGLLPAERMDEAMRVADERGAQLMDVLTATHAVDELAVAKALAEETGLPFLAEIKVELVPIDLVERTPINFARHHGVLPIGRDGNSVVVAVRNPLDPTPLDDLRALLGAPIIA